MPKNNHGILIDPTASQIGSAEQTVREKLEEIAVKEISSVNDAEDVTVRGLLPEEDLNAGDDNDWSDTPEFSQEYTGDGPAEVYHIDSNDRAENKVIGVIGVGLLGNSDTLATEVSFQNSTGGTFARYQLQGVQLDEEATGLFTDPVILKPDKDAIINHEGDDIADGEEDNIVYHAVVAEPSTTTLEESSRFLSSV